jgi:cytochrome c oxidase assembly protein subunit 15
LGGRGAPAAGPHAGGAGTGDVIKRLYFKGGETLHYVISQHSKLATLLGVVAVALWFAARRRGASAQQVRALTVVCVLLAVQGAIGALQYHYKLPAEIVWVHVGVAAATWVALLFCVVNFGRLQRAPRASAREPLPSP